MNIKRLPSMIFYAIIYKENYVRKEIGLWRN